MTDEQSSRNNLAYNTDNIGTMTLIFFQVTTLIEKLKNVAGGHIPVNMIPNLGDEDLNDESELREAEENLVQRLCHKMEKDFRFAKKLNGFKLLLSSALSVVETTLQSVRNVLWFGFQAGQIKHCVATAATFLPSSELCCTGDGLRQSLIVARFG